MHLILSWLLDLLFLPLILMQKIFQLLLTVGFLFVLQLRCEVQLDLLRYVGCSVTCGAVVPWK